ncbi:MAG: hypothetical protein ACK2T2_12415 [Anaerolineales bacterium]
MSDFRGPPQKRYGGLLPDEMRRLEALEDENVRLDLTGDVPDVGAAGGGHRINGSCVTKPHSAGRLPLQ